MADESYPPRADRCCSWSPSTKCEQRREAQKRGEFFYSFAHRGWLWGEEGRRVSQLMIDEHKAPFVWEWCPWCQGTLPKLSIIDAIEEGDDGN